MSPEHRLLHLYAQESFHDDAFIIGNRPALIALRDAIDETLDEDNTGSEKGSVEVMTNDGEGFNLIVKLDDSDWQKGTWPMRKTPYTAEHAEDKREHALNPWE